MVSVKAALSVFVLVLSLGVAGCGSDAPPTSPTPTPTPAPTPTPTPTPTPAPTTASLSGTVTSSTGTRIAGARITALDGPNAGQGVDANGNGEFRFDSLTIANTNFSATANGYTEDRRGTFVDGTNTLNFTLTLRPVAQTLSVTANCCISGGTGTTVQEWSFAATTSGNPTITNWSWDFGDGFTASNSGPAEQHVYRNKGTYTVTLTATRAGNATPLVATVTVEVI